MRPSKRHAAGREGHAGRGDTKKIGGKGKGTVGKAGPWGYGELVALRKVVHMLQNRSIADEGHFESLTSMMIPGRRLAEIQRMRSSDDFLRFLRGHGVGMIFNNSSLGGATTTSTTAGGGSHDAIVSSGDSDAGKSSGHIRGGNPAADKTDAPFDLSSELRRRAMAGLDGSIGLKPQTKASSPSKAIVPGAKPPLSAVELLRLRMKSSLDHLF